MLRRLRKIRLDYPEAAYPTARKKHAMTDTMLMLAVAISAISFAATRVIATLAPTPASKARLAKVGSRGC